MSRETEASRRQEILRRHEAGHFHTAIAADYGISRGRVGQIVKAEGGAPRRGPRPLSAASEAEGGRPNWPAIPKEDLRVLLSRYCDEGLSAQQISDRFENCSRSAAIGQIRRFKLKLNAGKPRRGMAGRRSKAGAIVEAKIVKPALRPTKLVQQTRSWRGPNNPVAIDFKARALQRAASPGIVIRREHAFEPIQGAGPVAFGSPGCKWPVDGLHGVGLFACGAAKDLDQSYCSAHRLLSYQPPSTRQRAGLRSAERIL